ncbi:hypothetical protein [Bradyrhizobium erythrophlei]|uniref:Uncharacterized protein n=1 Tax=Bradyrhizobium erythrophlei TaxID=1437360 RepID=A0A1M5PS97_9BRAD|nr:hypothetical protein [Bradyrhizobium erythrophlei]SHH04456.1 hypothetical protein SAMN05443248_3483 [Bradyrhizobium erythrophlei]
MDPTMGQTGGVVIEAGASAYLGGAAEMLATQGEVATSAEAVAAADTMLSIEQPPAVPATNYPVGAVDFNKAIEVFDRHDDSVVHTNARVLAVLDGNAYPVVVVSTNTDGDELVTQFDTDGDDFDGDLRVANAQTGDLTRFLVIYRSGRDFGVYDDLFASEDAAIEQHGDDNDFHAIVPITIPAQAQVIDHVSESEEEDEITETVAEALPEGAVTVNGRVVKPGDKVRAYRRNYGERQVNVLKTRTTKPWKALLVQADDGTAPYWALNSNIRFY